MTIYVDTREGSKNLPPYLRSLGASVVEGRYQTDVEFLGFTSFGPSSIGIEHKQAKTGDVFDSMASGRLAGEQLPQMVKFYQAIRYVIIEGNLRASAKDGVLEIKKWGGGQWEPAYSRNGRGWTYDEFQNRIDSIEEFFSYPHCSGRTMVKRTFDEHETARFIVGRQAYWSRPYDSHSSARQWHEMHRSLPPLNAMIPTSEIPLVQKWAHDIDGIGDKKSTFVARHFKTPIALAIANESQWLEVVCLESKKGQHNLVQKHFSKTQVRKFIQQIKGEK